MKTLYRITLLLLISSAFLLVAPGRALSAVPGYLDFLPAWSSVASACTVDESDLTDFAASGPTLGFNTGKTGTVVARCAVHNPKDSGNPSWNGLIVDYQDPDGKGVNAQVRVYLRRYSRSTGSFVTIASFDSSLFAITTRTEGLKTFIHTMDFLNNEYYVEIQIYRNTTEFSPIVRAVRLSPVQKIPE